MAYNLGTASGNIRIEYDSRGVARARDDLGRFVSLSDLTSDHIDRNSKRNARSFSLLHPPLLKIVKIMGIVYGAAQLLVSGFGAIQGVLQSIIPIAQAALASLPGLILAIVATVAILKLAFSGLGDAIKAAFEQDLDKFNEALKKLAPEAQNFARAIFAAVKELKPLQQAVQQAFFAGGGLASHVENASKAFLGLEGQMSRTSHAAGFLAGSILKFATSPEAIAAIDSVLKGLEGTFNALAPAMEPFFKGFFALATQLGPFLEGFATAAGEALTKFGEFLGGVQLQPLMNSAGEALKGIIQLISGLGSIFLSLMSVFTTGSGAVDDFGESVGGTKNSLGALVTTVADFLKSAAGTQALDALGVAIGAIASGGGQALLAFLKAISPALVALAPLVAVLARVLGNTLATAFETLAPAVLAIAEALNANLGSILPTIMDAFLQLAPVIGRVADLVAGVLSGAMVALAPVISQIATSLSDLLLAALEAILPMLEDWLPVWQQLAADALPQIAPLISEIVNAIIPLIPLILLATNIFMQLLIPAMKLFVPVALFFVQTSTNMIHVIGLLIGWIVGLVGKFIDLGGNISSISGVAGNMASAVGGFFSGLVTKIGQAISNSISKIGELVGFVRGLPGQISAAIGNLGSLLFSAGADVIQGLINGIRSKIGAVADAARNAVAAIPGVVKNVLGISSPSKVTAALGEEVSRGLALGILRTLGVVQAAASTAAMTAIAGMPTNMTATVSAAVARASGTAPSPATQAVTVNQAAPIPAVGSVVVNAVQTTDPAAVGAQVGARIALRLATGA